MQHKRRTSPDRAGESGSPAPVFRSAAVAQLADMPVATLRIWEQRYAAVRPARAASGHRLYSAADVQRVLLLRQLTERGHAIGSIAGLDSEQLRRLGVASETGATATSRTRHRTVAPPRVLVVGPALAMRLQRDAVVRRLSRPPRVVSIFESLADAANAGAGVRADLLLWHAPELLPGGMHELRAAQTACGVAHAAIVYRFANEAALSEARTARVATVREPSDDPTLGAWLASITDDLAAAASRGRHEGHPRALHTSTRSVAPRRFDDAFLTAIAGRSHTVACECPRNVAELLMQLSSFESYSAACVDRSPDDATLHAYLQHVAATSRALFESALERVARHEGVSLP